MALYKNFSRVQILGILICILLGTGFGVYISFSTFQSEMNNKNNEVEALKLEASLLILKVSDLEIDLLSLQNESEIYEAEIFNLKSQILSLLAREELIMGYISIEQAKVLIESNIKPLILDVRTEEEFNNARIEGSINIPLDQVQSRHEELNMNDTIIIYCRSGMRSDQAFEKLYEFGFKRIYRLIGGIEAWAKAGYTIYRDLDSCSDCP